jgi:hypothetical protein
MPQARSSGSGSEADSSAKSTPAKRSTAKSTGRARSASAKTSAKSTTAKASTAKRTSAKSAARKRASASSSGPAAQAKAAAASAEQRAEAVAQRLRKLNERIIEAGKVAGESTLTSYEKALKAIAGSLERGPGSSEIDWISSLATHQAKFIRDVTSAWTNAARQMLPK